MTTPRPYGVGPYGAGPYSRYLSNEIAGRASGVFRASATAIASQIWGQPPDCHPGSWTMIACAEDAWQSAEDCGTGSWRLVSPP